MNKEEIEEIKKLLFQDRLTQYGKRKLVQHLEQKEAILDKVTDKLKEVKFEIECTYSQINGHYFIAQDRLDLVNEILNIIEGEKK